MITTTRTKCSNEARMSNW